MIEVGNVIRRRREAARMSQLSLALAIGYKNNSDISRIEKGAQWPDAEKLALIADALNCSVTDLFAEAEGKVQGTREAPAPYPVMRTPHPEEVASPAERDPLTPPSLDDALQEVRFMLTGTDSPELLAAIAYQGLMTRYATERICSSINNLVVAVESLRDEIERNG